MAGGGGQNGKEIGDGQTKIVYNVSAFEKADNPKLKALLQYLSTETVTDEARTLAEKVAAFKRHFPDGRPHMKYELDLYDKWCEGKEECRKEGIKEGREKSLRDVVLTAFRQGFSVETIASLTNLTVEEIEKLRASVRP